MDPEPTDEDFRTCPGCSDAIKVNCSKQIYLIRRGEYWHEGCFRCRLCNSPISDCSYYCFEDYVCHMSCYNQQNDPEGATYKPKDHIVCRVCQGLNKMLKWTLRSFKKDEGQLHHLEETEQPHETVASLVGSAYHESTSNDQYAATTPMDTTPSTQAGPSASRESPSEITADNEEESQGVNCSIQEQNLPGDKSKGKMCSKNAMDNVSSIPAGKIESPQQRSPSNGIEGCLGAGSSCHEQKTGDNSKKDQISHSSASKSAGNSNANLNTCDNIGDLTSISSAITAKYGDISKNCTLSSKTLRSTFWEKICSTVQTLQATSVKDFNDCEMSEMFDLLNDIKKVGFDVEWLLCHLHKMKNMMELQKAQIGLGILQDEQQEIGKLLKESIELKEEELLKLKSQMEETCVKCAKISHEIAVIEAGLQQKHMLILEE